MTLGGFAGQMPIVSIGEFVGVEIFMMREDLRHPGLSGNKFWKLLLPVKKYLELNPAAPQLITFGGAFSNHIAATAHLGRQLGIPSLGIIRGEELATSFYLNPTLGMSSQLGMEFRFVTREEYRKKEILTEKLQNLYPEALIIPEGGALAEAAESVAGMLTDQTAAFDYLCAPVGTGTTLAGLLKGAATHQKVLGVAVVRDPALRQNVERMAGIRPFELWDGSFGGYGKFDDQMIHFINEFYRTTKIPLDPVYTGKMMKAVLTWARCGSFPQGSRVLCFHTGGLRGILGANEFLKRKNRTQIEFRFV